MPDATGFGELAFERAALAVEETLREALGVVPERLDTARVRGEYPQRRYDRGWRVSAGFPDGTTRRIDLLVTRHFPAGYPRTALVDRPEHLRWPHIEHDGILCLLPPTAEVDAENPGAVAANLVGRSARLVEELIEGTIVERDFREEFLTYWFYKAEPGASRVQSLLRPEGPSRLVSTWRDDEGLIVAAEDDNSLDAWLEARLGPAGRGKRKFRAGALLWLARPPVPAGYPETGADLLALADCEGDGVGDLLRGLAAGTVEDLLVLLGAEGRGGPGLVAASTTSARKSPFKFKGPERPLTKGFRDAPLAGVVAVERMFSAAPLVRANVDRADAPWIHGRGHDARAARLLASVVTVVGCGSVGSSVAARLARAGVGWTNLVDPEDLAWSNVGRHELGAGSVGRNKALELAARLRRDLPHLSFHGHAAGAHSLVEHGALLAASDLVVVATGSWDADGALNRWHVADGRRKPFVYCWAEECALAGHAVEVATVGGCLRCGVGATGVPAFRATEWPDGAPAYEEPACGNPYQPYGAVDIASVVDLAARIALDALLSPASASRHAMFMGAQSDIVAQGGQWTGDLLGVSDEPGARRIERDWPRDPACPACGEVVSGNGVA